MDGVSEFADYIEILVVSLSLDHDFCCVVLPDGVCKMEREVLVRSSCELGKLGRKKCGRVGDQDGLCRKKRSQSFIESDFGIDFFSHGFNDQISIFDCLLHIELKLDVLISSFSSLNCLFSIERITIGKTAAPRRRIRCSTFHLLDISKITFF